MKHLLAKESLTNEDIIAFLEQTAESVMSMMNRIDPNDPYFNSAIEDADNLLVTCKSISEKIQKEESLDDEEKNNLKILLTTIQKNINRGIFEGSSKGLDTYIKMLGE